MDLFAAGHIDKYRLFKNTNCPGSFIQIRLAGQTSNPNGIGSRIEVWNYGEKTCRYVLPNGGLHDFSSLDVNIGLNGAYSVDSIIVYWPSGIIQKIWATNGNQFLTVAESETTGLTTSREAPRQSLSVVPNPVADQGTVNLNLTHDAFITLSVFSLEGKKIKTLFENRAEAGTHLFEIHADDFTDGVYLIQAKGDHIWQTCKLVVQRQNQ